MARGVKTVRPKTVRAGVFRAVRAGAKRGRGISGNATASGAIRKGSGRARSKPVVVQG